MDADLAAAWIYRAAGVIAENRDHLTNLDAAIGDSDHGINMDRGLAESVRALQASSPSSPGEVLLLVGNTLISKVGGASGPLYGTAFRRAGKHLGDVEVAAPQQVAEALREAVNGIRQLGAASPGDKTMVDALLPAVMAFEGAVEAGADLAGATQEAAKAAQEGALATIPLQALKGRASYLGARSMGHEDPGAASAALILGALADVAGDALDAAN